MSDDSDLTESQRQAVEYFEGPLLVVAGPGSGKTRVITRRIARLIDRGVHPDEILAITFTNKAARVMSDRVRSLLPRSHIWVSTFHRLCARLIREYASVVGLRPNFSIYDVSDQLSLLKSVMHDLDIDGSHFPAAKLLGRISKAKNELITADMYASRFGASVGNHLEATVARVYPKYQQQLLAANAVDFDDLLVHVARMLHEHDELRTSLDERFRFILVDEYQDTNRAQYQIVAALSQQQPNLCVTGDPDQSIYGWRGARIENILGFERDFPQVQMIRLEENFRSTPEILAAADALIRHNVQRKQKVLRPTRPGGEPVEIRQYVDGQDEAKSIAAEIQSLVKSQQRSFDDFAIFYRVNSLSRTLETALSRLKIPYQMAGGLAFYERAEIKDVLSYLRIIENPRDRLAFLRTVNNPPRGVGKTSLDRFVRWADEAGIELLAAAQAADRVPALPKKAIVGLRSYATLIQNLSEFAANPFGEAADSTEFHFDESDNDSTSQEQLDRGPVEAIVKEVLQRTGYYNQYEGTLEEEELQRKSNVDELISSARLFDQQLAEQEEVATLGGFLETASLTQDVDAWDETSGAVTLMTLHAAKGLEFSNVYLVGLEQNLLPHERSLRDNDKQAMEEERRLLFVGITRAKERLVMTYTDRREMHGRTLSTIPSDFLTELPVERRSGSGAFGEAEMDHDHDSFTPDHDADHWDETPVSQGEVLEQILQSFPATRGTKKSKRKPPKSRMEPHLTTGAALESGSGQRVDIPAGFGLGMQVRHPRYGLGTVIEVSGFSRMRTVTVEFQADNRRESFIAAKCPLQPIGFS